MGKSKPFSGLELTPALRGLGRLNVSITPNEGLHQMLLTKTDAPKATYDQCIQLALGCRQAEARIILTCRDGFTEDWKRPHSARGRRVSIMGAAAISNHAKESMPVCIYHGLNPERPTPHLRLCLNKTVCEGKHDVFHCEVPGCQIYFILTKTTAPARILQSAQDVQAYQRQYEVHDDDDDDDDVEVVASNSTSSSPSKSTSAAPFKPSNSKSLSPRFQVAGTSSASADVFPSLFSEAVAKARATNDKTAVMTILHCGQTGLYRRSPQSHPAFDVERYLALDVYDRKLYPNGVERSGGELWEFAFTTNAGYVVRALSSATGIPLKSLDVLWDESTICDACQCVFTRIGYNRHVVAGKCSSWYEPVAVARKDIPADAPAQLVERTYAAGATVEANPGLKQTLSFQESRLGTALLAYNSSIGVPQDVWAVISTAYTVCDDCYLARNFSAHAAHCDEFDRCQDPGQASTQGTN